jgi:hypothetical protein
MEVHELKPGLWRWTARHPEWDGSVVSSAYLEAPDAACLIDPLVPCDEEEHFFAALLRLLLELAADLVVPSHGEPFAVTVLAAPLHSPPSAA